MQSIIREALRKHLLDDTVDPDDPLYTSFPLDSGGVEGPGFEPGSDDDLLYGDPHNERR